MERKCELKQMNLSADALSVLTSCVLLAQSDDSNRLAVEHERLAS